MKPIGMLVILPLFLVLASTARADVIQLANGDEIDGEIIEETADCVRVRVMTGGFKSKVRKIPRNKIVKIERTRKEEPKDLVELFILAVKDPKGVRTVLSIVFLPFILPALALFVLSLILKHRPAEFWKALCIAAPGWFVPAGFIFLLYGSMDKAALWCGLVLFLAPGFLGAVFLYRERRLRAALFPAVHLAALAVAMLVVKAVVT